MRQLFTGMHDSSHCLHRLLLENSVESVTIHTLRNHKNYPVPFARTNRFKNSFLLYALWNFQWVLLNICNLCNVYWHFIEFIGLLVCHCHFIQPQGCKINKIWLIDNNLQTYPSIAKFFVGLPSMTNIAPSEDAVNIKSPLSENLPTYENTIWDRLSYYCFQTYNN